MQILLYISCYFFIWGRGGGGGEGGRCVNEIHVELKFVRKLYLNFWYV